MLWPRGVFVWGCDVAAAGGIAGVASAIPPVQVYAGSEAMYEHYCTLCSSKCCSLLPPHMVANLVVVYVVRSAYDCVHL